MRGFIVVVLIVVGGLLAVVANTTIWAERTIIDEDSFVSTVDRVFEDEAVQTALAERLTDEVMELTGIEGLISEGLAGIERRAEESPTEGRIVQGNLVLLTGPLTGVAREAVFQTALRMMEAQPLANLREAALRTVHSVVVALIENDKNRIAIVGEEVILDLRSILEEIVKDIGGETGEELLASLDIPDDAGKIVLTEKSEITLAWWLAEQLHTYYPHITGITVAALVIAVAISRSRRRTAIAVGGTVAVTGALALVVIDPLGEWVTDAMSSEGAKVTVGALYDNLLRSFKLQSFFLMLGGVVLATGASLAGDSDLVAAVRSTFRRRAPGAAAPPSVGLAMWVRERVQVLRVGGLGAAAFLLIAWPEPTTRFQVTVLALVALYLVLLTIVSSDAQWAVSTRSRVGGLWERYFRIDEAAAAAIETRPQSLLGWVAARASWFRAVGIAVGVLLLVSWPSLTFGIFVAVIALELLYLAAIEVIVNRASG